MQKRAEKRKYHYIYKIAREDGAYYIGMHSTDDLEDGYFGSDKRLWYSIKKHSKEKHTKEILEFLPSREELKIRDRALVNEELLTDPQCMNLTIGGEAGGGWRGNSPSANWLKANCSPGEKSVLRARKSARTLKNRCADDPEYDTLLKAKLGANSTWKYAAAKPIHPKRTLRERRLL